MIRRLPILAFILIHAAAGRAGTLPGFRLERLVVANGFVTSIVMDSADRVYYSVTRGGIYRIEAGGSTLVATVDTAAEGNAALLGIAFRGDTTIVAHYVEPDLSADVIAAIDLTTGLQTSTRLVCNSGNPCSTEHHGGNPVAAPDGTIYVGIGDFGASHLAQNPDSPAGKILRMSTDGSVQMFAWGFRNPFDFAIEAATQSLIVADNGVIGDDEINIIKEGDNAGWPMTMGNQTPVAGTVTPIFVFPQTIAPTGMVLLNDKGRLSPGGLLLGGFVSKALYYFPDMSLRPLPPPIELFRSEIGPVLDVAQSPSGEIYVANPSAIYRLVFPQPGDADGNGRVDSADFRAISREILDGDGNEAIRAHEGSYRGSWGADANLDGVIDSRDLVTLARHRIPRRRGAHP